MTSQPWDSSGNARRALQGIVRDPQFGPAALSQPAVMTNLLKDLLPDEPREAGLIVAAAQADLAGTLRGYAAQGVDPGTAVRLTAGSFVSNTSHTPQACTWIVTELAAALGMDTADKTVVPSADATAAQATLLAPDPPRPSFTPAGQPVQPGQFVQPAQPAQPGWQPQGSPWQVQPFPAPGERSVMLRPGIAGLAGAFLLLLGCALPYVRVSGQSGVSLFGGFHGAPASETFWFAIEPGGVMVIAAIISVLLLARGSQPAFCAGLLTAFGVQTVLLFSGYVFVVYAPNHRGAGGVLGLLGGIVLIVAGLMAATAARGAAAAAGAPAS